jgi:SAM-dependent methyltransferase
MQKLYTQLASWWPLMSSPDEYVEEAAFIAQQLAGAGDQPCRTLLELGSGGGNNASHLKAHFDLTLVDPSPGMLALSRQLNPECEHHQGDMRDVRLGRRFDRVLIHDAICYMTTEADLRRALETAFEHCRPGGAAVFAPDHVRETFQQSSDHGGGDASTRGMRYLEWTWDPDPDDSTYTVDYAYLLRDADGTVRVEHDRHVEGLFARATWLRLLADVGLEARVGPFEHTQIEPGSHELFVGERPG